MTIDAHIRRAAAQFLATEKMLGADFIVCAQAGTAPQGRPAGGSGAAIVETKPAADVSRPVAAPAQSTTQKKAALDALRERHDAECPHCTTVTTHTQTVFGEGDPDAALMFVGEAPGADEDRTGRPFVGRAGQKLEEIIKAMGLTREQVYIANLLKSRPPNNRTPLQGEVEQCSPYLIEQIRIIAPRVIVTLGGPATKCMLETTEGITRIRGIWSQFTDPQTGHVTPVMPTFHPAYLLRAYTPENRRKVWSDMQAVMERLGSA